MRNIYGVWVYVGGGMNRCVLARDDVCVCKFVVCMITLVLLLCLYTCSKSTGRTTTTRWHAVEILSDSLSSGPV